MCVCACLGKKKRRKREKVNLAINGVKTNYIYYDMRKAIRGKKNAKESVNNTVSIQ